LSLWLLLRVDKSVLYDTADGFVVRAGSELSARRIAALDCGDEQAETWLNIRTSTCTELSADGEEGIILRDFRAG